jgi:UDPglucose 6-dehydrogenase
LSRITVIGAGYVGLVTSACLAHLGHDVCCLDIDEGRIRQLSRGHVPLHEHGLRALVAEGARARRLRFCSSYADAIPGAQFIFIAVNTPAASEGQADLMPVRSCAAALAPLIDPGTILVNKSTVPIGTAELLSALIARHTRVPFSVVSNPEFLREGSAVSDFLHPDRLVVGAVDPAVAQQVVDLYGDCDRPVIVTDVRTAEMIKYASNAFLATRISFVNEISAICEHLGADVRTVARGMGYDHRIGPHFLNAGIGWGGSCFPKDVQALIHMAAANGTHPQLLRAVVDINHHQRLAVVQKLKSSLGLLEDRIITLFGLSFKPDTDDLRNAPAIEIAQLLHHEGCHVRAFDPVVPSNAAGLAQLELFDDPYAAADGADAIVLVTEWSQFAELDLARLRSSLRTPVLVDGRNMYVPEEMLSLGFDYHGMGLGSLRAFPPSNSGLPHKQDMDPGRPERQPVIAARARL